MNQHLARTAVSLDLPLPAPAQTRNTHHSQIQIPAFHIERVWREAFSVYLLNAPAMLMWTLAGLAGVRMVCLLLSIVIGLQVFVHSYGAFLNTQGLLGVASIVDQRLFVLLVLQAIIGAVLRAFAKGAITCLALQTSPHPDHESSSPLRFASTCLRVKQRLPALLAGSLLNSAICALAAITLIVPLLALRIDPLGFTPSHTIFARMNALTDSIGAQYINMAANEAGSPFAEFVPYWRNAAFRDVPIWTNRSQDVSHDLSDRQQKNKMTSRESSSQWQFVWRVSLICIALILFASVLLRFYPAIALDIAHEQHSHSLNTFTSLAASIGFGMRHFCVIAVHALILRVVYVIASVTFIILPNVFVEKGVMPALTSISGLTWLAPVSVILSALCLTAASAIVEGFITVLNARLYLSLKPAR